MPHDLEFAQGVMKLSSFDPKLNRFETRVLRLPDVPTFESLEHLFVSTHTSSSLSCSSSSPSHQQALTTRFIEVFQAEPTMLRSTRSLTTNKKSTSGRIPRRCYSNPYLSKKKDSLLTGSSTDTWMSSSSPPSSSSPRRTPSRRNLLRAFTGLLQRAASVRRSSSSASLKRNSNSFHDEQVNWHTGTYTIEMRSSFDRPRPLKKKRCHAENWWAASPSPVAHAL